MPHQSRQKTSNLPTRTEIYEKMCRRKNLSEQNNWKKRTQKQQRNRPTETEKTLKHYPARADEILKNFFGWSPG